MRDSRVRDSVSIVLVQLYRRISREHNKALKPLGLSTMQAHILLNLWEHDGSITVGELQRQLCVSSSTITGALDRMEKQGLVTRESVAQDRRSFSVRAAAWPKRRRERVMNVLVDTEDRCYGTLSASERQTLLRLLRRVLADRLDTGDP